MKVIYYQDELHDEFSTAKITARTIDASYDYGGGRGWQIGRFVCYRMIARPLAWLFLKLRFGHRIIGRGKIKCAHKSGFFLYGNHTNAGADALIPSMIAYPAPVSVVVHPNNVSMPVFGHITPYLGALPLPDDLGAARNFQKELFRRVKKGACIAIYPEAHIWPYYTDIRPFPADSFGYAVSAKTPVFCFTNTYQKRLLGTRITTYVEGPFYPEESLPRREARQKLRDEVFCAMKANTVHNEVTRVIYRKEE